MNSDVFQLPGEEERILASFTRRLIEIAAVASVRGPVMPATSMLNSMRLPAIALDRRGFVVDVNAAAAAVFDEMSRSRTSGFSFATLKPAQF